MTGAEEVALAAAAAEVLPEIVGAGSIASGSMAAMPAFLTAGEAAAGAGAGAGAGLWATGAGESLGGGLGAAFGMPESSMLAAFGPTAEGVNAMNMATAMGQGPPMMSNLLGMPAMPGAQSPFAMGATTAQPGMASAFGPNAAVSSYSKWTDPNNMMKAGQMIAQAGGQPQQQGAPQASAYEQPSMRSALATQEQITKKWLLKNDPKTYRRIYGEPQGAM